MISKNSKMLHKFQKIRIIRLFFWKRLSFPNNKSYLKHLLKQSIDVLFSVTKVTTFNKVIGDLSPATRRSRQSDGGQPVVSLFEVGADGIDFVDQVFDAVDAQRAQTFFDDSVVDKLDSLTVDQTSTSFVEHLLDGFLRRITP